MRKSLTLFAAIACGSMHAQPGTLDPTFGIGGKAIATVPGNYSSGECIAEQADGKIIVGGATPGFALLARFNADGTLDSGFGTNGLVLTDADESNDSFGAVAVQPDGRIVAGGVRFNNASDGRAIIARYMPDGTLDNGFGTNGIRTINIAGALDSFVKALAVQPDGRIAVLGEYWTGTTWRIFVTRLLATGVPDGNFGLLQPVIVPGNNEYAGDLALQADGKWVICGQSQSPGNGGFYVARIDPDGLFDSSFGTTGSWFVDLGLEDEDLVRSVRVQPDGHIVLGGIIRQGGAYGVLVVRLLPNGVMDPAFGNFGYVSIPIAIDDWALPSVALQPDGGILVGVDNNTSNAPRVKVARLLPDGQLDAGFGTNGIGTSNATTGNDDEYAVRTHFLADGGIAVAGFVDTPNNIQVAVWKFRSGVNVGVDEAEALRALSILPNPVQDSFTLRTEAPIDPAAPIMVRDASGRAMEVSTTRTAHAISIDAARLPSGPYFATAGTTAGPITARFIKQ